jgi:hypothetical protein
MTLPELEHTLDTFVDPADLWGDDRDGWFKQVKVLCHPDRWVKDRASGEKAQELLLRVTRLMDDVNHPVTLKSPKRSYLLTMRLSEGDIADVFLATSGGNTYVVKVSRVIEGAKMVESEAKIIASLLKETSTTHFDHYFPTLCEHFAMRDRITKHVNVYVHEGGFYTLEEVHRRHPMLDGRHLAWIFNRLLTAIGAAHLCGWLHGAVCPPHVLVQAENHGMKLVGWGQGVRIGERIASGPKGYLPWYPKEVKEKQPATTSTDIYMAALCMKWLSGDDLGGVPAEMGRFFRSCLLEGPGMRPDDAWDLLEDFDALLKRIYGRRRFHRLEMNP